MEVMPNTYRNQYTSNPAWQRVKEIDEKMQALRKKAIALRDERIKLVGSIYGQSQHVAEHSSGPGTGERGNR